MTDDAVEIAAHGLTTTGETDRVTVLSNVVEVMNRGGVDLWVTVDSDVDPTPEGRDCLIVPAGTRARVVSRRGRGDVTVRLMATAPCRYSLTAM